MIPQTKGNFRWPPAARAIAAQDSAIDDRLVLLRLLQLEKETDGANR
jgi:hypothetical protein